ERQQLARERRGALPGALDEIEILPQRMSLADRRAHAVAVAVDDREQVVEVVGEAAGELPDGLELLRVPEPRFGIPAFGDVDERDERAGPAADDDGLGGGQGHQQTAVFPFDLDLHLAKTAVAAKNADRLLHPVS